MRWYLPCGRFPTINMIFRKQKHFLWRPKNKQQIRRWENLFGVACQDSPKVLEIVLLFVGGLWFLFRIPKHRFSWILQMVPAPESQTPCFHKRKLVVSAKALTVLRTNRLLRRVSNQKTKNTRTFGKPCWRGLSNLSQSLGKMFVFWRSGSQIFGFLHKTNDAFSGISKT